MLLVLFVLHTIDHYAGHGVFSLVNRDFVGAQERKIQRLDALLAIIIGF